MNINVSMAAALVAHELAERDRRLAKRSNRQFKKFMRDMDRVAERNARRYRIDRMFYDIGFEKVPFSSGRVPKGGGVAYEPNKGKPLFFDSYDEAEAWLKKAGAWK
jgi:hypothetical protein